MMSSGLAPALRLELSIWFPSESHNNVWQVLELTGAPRVIRTPDLRIRSPSLYPTELWAQGEGL